MDKLFNIFVGFDGKVEPVAYSVFCQSVIENASIPVSFCPLALNTLSGYEEKHTDGSNAFIYSRFLVPALMNYKGYALWVDGDMVCLTDIAEILEHIDDTKAVVVVKHDYETKHPIKYLGAKNDDYPRKNWSSVILWNCAHPANKILTPEFIMQSTGQYLHRFSWLDDNMIGELPIDWNWLAEEYDIIHDAKLIHYTLGTPCFEDYQRCDYSKQWWETYLRMIYPLTGIARNSSL